MSTFARILFVLGPVMYAQEPPTSLTVAVENASRVPPRILASAQQEAARIFARAGIELVWTRRDPAGPRVPVLKVVDRFDRAGYDLRLGFALVPDPGRDFAGYAVACARCVEETVTDGSLAYALSLGYVIAHELGHVLLGSDSHSLTGIMAPEFPVQGLLRVPRDAFLFSSAQAEKMRRRASSRVAALTTP